MAAALAFLLSPVARTVGIAVLGLGLIGFVYAKGYASGVAEATRQVEQASAAAHRRWQAMTTAALEAAQNRALAARRESEANRLRADELATALAARRRADEPPPAACRCSLNPALSPGDAEKLNAIR